MYVAVLCRESSRVCCFQWLTAIAIFKYTADRIIQALDGVKLVDKEMSWLRALIP